MIRLVSAEMQRFVSRRLFQVFSLLAVVGFVVAGVAVFVVSSDAPEDLAAFEAERAALVDDCTREIEAAIETEPQSVMPDARKDPRAYCEETTWLESPAFEYRSLDWMLMGFSLPFMIVAWLFGASFVGAEWHNRTMTTMLTWEPRRGRVLAAKALATVAIVFLWIVAMEAVAAAAFYPAAEFEGSMVGVDGAWWWDVVQIVLRAGALGAALASSGLALATIGRNTAAALGVGFGYFAIVENLIKNFKPSWHDWLISPNVSLALDGAETAVGHSQAAAGLLLLAYVCVALAAAIAVFKRRDIA